MILGIELKKRLDASIELRGLTLEHERQVKAAVLLLIPDVMKIIGEEVKAAKRENIKVRADVE